MPLSLNRASIFAEGLDHPECIAAHPDGTFFAGGESGQIYHISADGKQIKEIANTGGFILGVAISPDGKWLAICDLKKQCVWRLDIAGRTLSELSRGGSGADRFGIPNHLAFTCDGALFVTDSGAFRKVTGRIYKLDENGRGGVWHAGPFNFANGIAIGPKDDAVYVVCTWLPGVERIRINADGSAGKRSVYAKIPKALPDGLTFDARGNLYVSCYTPARIYKVSPKKKVSVLIDDWEAHMLSNPTNVAFGGKNFDQLFAANLGRWHITRIDVKTKGLPLACHRD
ncbi:SMP-30/gluconolactonase/LRE family protein [soil metagenome]